LGRNDIEFVQAEEHKPFGDGELDLCMSFNGLHCPPKHGAAFREIARCLAPGGRLIGDTVVRGTG
jgi:SAM-dependent methyltransferase